MKNIMKRSEALVVTADMSNWVKNARAVINMSQGKLASELGEQQTWLSTLERGAAKFVSRDKWAKVVKALVDKGAPPMNVDPMQNVPDPKVLRNAVIRLKKEKQASWGLIAETLGTHETTLMNLVKKEKMSIETLLKIRDGLDRLNAKPGELVAQGHVKGEKAKPAPVKRRKKSIIEAVPASRMPTAQELDLREWEIIQRLRSYQQPPAMLNGKRH